MLYYPVDRNDGNANGHWWTDIETHMETHSYAEGSDNDLVDTDQMVNVCVKPPSNPGSQEMLAWFTPTSTDTEDTAWGLVPVT